MKKANKRLIIFLTVICTLISYLPSYAYVNQPDVVVSMQIDNPLMKVNGAETEIDLGRGTTPVILNGRTLVPIRAVIEAFDGTVSWNASTKTITLNMPGDVIKLTIDSSTGYLNNTAYTLDASPVIINERTMLPIRFIAEGFNLGVAWDDKSKTVTLVRNSLDYEEYTYLTNTIPAYSGAPYVVVNNNIPFFKEYELINASFEYYSKLDSLNRCDVCMASVAKDLMPTGERESISSVTPTGWINVKYDVVSGGYLYNRCHLIGYQLTGENANKRNLITGTRYLNIDGMLSFENKIDEYVERTGNHVLYRVSPVFKGNNLLADGVLLEAYSVEDNGSGISFCVYCYNVQPSIIIDYSTGASSQEISYTDTQPTVTESHNVYRTPTGKKYHFDAECGGKNSYKITMESALSARLGPCAKCTK